MDAIVYTSNAGHTKEYAELLSAKTELPAYSMEEAGSKLSKESQIIYMGWLMAGTIKGLKEAAVKYQIQAVCPVGMTLGGVDRLILAQKNPLPDSMPLFYLQGGFEIQKLHGLYKFMMNLMRGTVKKNLRKVPNRTEEENEMLSMMTYGANLVNENKLDEVLAWFQGLDA